MNKLVSFLIFLIIGCNVLAQPKGDFNPKKEITYDGKRYTVYNNYLTVGGGTEYNTYLQNTNLNVGADFNFHIRAIYFQSGFFLAGNRFRNWSQAQLHLAVGKRFEFNKFNMAGYLGASGSSINRVYFDSAYQESRVHTLHPFGLHATVQFTYKIKYDVGIGVALFSDINAVQSVYGLRLELYFSSAFMGYRRGGPDENSVLFEEK